MLGHAVHPEEALLTVGLDSRGGMELRRGLAEALGLQLPVTLLYDHQSVADIVRYINAQVRYRNGTVCQASLVGPLDGLGTEGNWVTKSKDGSAARLSKSLICCSLSCY